MANIRVNNGALRTLRLLLDTADGMTAARKLVCGTDAGRDHRALEASKQIVEVQV